MKLADIDRVVELSVRLQVVRELREAAVDNRDASVKVEGAKEYRDRIFDIANEEMLRVERALAELGVDTSRP